MYNAFIASRQSIQLEQIKKRTQADRKYVRRYYNITRPTLIDNHNKRINSFIRRMQQEPIQIHLDPYLKHQKSNLNDSYLKTKKRSLSNNTGRKQYSSSMDQYQYMPLHTFKFKDNEDWKSLYTPLQRLQRQRNYELFREKYGDPTIAYRSIGSQSQYKTGHEFRQREKNLQINPPMRYTNKPTKQVLAKLKSKYSRNKKTFQQHHHHESKTNLATQSKQDDPFVRRNTGSSLSGMNQDNLLGQNVTQKASKQEQQIQNKDLQSSTQKKNNKNKKMHFKQLMDLQQNISDAKTRKALRQILYKCGIYKKKNKRAVTDSQVDQLSQFTDGRQH